MSDQRGEFSPSNDAPRGRTPGENLNYVLHGTTESHETEDNAAFLVDGALDRVLSYRPLPNEVLTIQELDRTLASVRKPVNAHEVDQTVQRVKKDGYHFWEFNDSGNGPLLPSNDDFFYTESLFPYLKSNPYAKNASPEKRMKEEKQMREIINGARTSAAAAEKVLTSEDLPLEQKLFVEEWNKKRADLVKHLVAGWGIERAALTFGDTKSNQALDGSAQSLLRFVGNQKFGELPQSLQQTAVRMNDFVDRQFWWAKEFDIDAASTGLHADPVREKVEPLLHIVEEWVKLPLYEQRDEISSAFTASSALARLKEVMSQLPATEQSAFRRKAVEEIKHAWRNQLITTASEIREGLEAFAGGEMLGRGSSDLEEKVRPLTSALTFTEEQRHEVAQSLALLKKRFHNVQEFFYDLGTRSLTVGQETYLSAIKTLLGFEPKGHFYMFPRTTCMEIIFVSNEDYDTAHGGQSSSDGFFRVAKDEHGNEIPVVALREAAYKGFVSKHERVHALYNTKIGERPVDLPRFAREDTYFGGTVQKRLREISNRSVLPRVKDEIVAYIASGAEENWVKDLLTNSPLYDYFSQHATQWGFGNPEDQNALEQEKGHYKAQAIGAIDTAFAIKKEFSLSDEDSATLLAILPMEQWRHLTGIPPQEG